MSWPTSSWSFLFGYKVLRCVFFSACNPPAVHCSQGRSARLSQGSHAGFSSNEILLRGNILYYHWREDKQSKGWRKKPWAFNRCRRLRTSPVRLFVRHWRLYFLFTMQLLFPDLYWLEAMMKKKRVWNILWNTAKLTLAQDSRYEKVTKQLRNFPTLNSNWKGIKHWIQLWTTQTLSNTTQTLQWLIISHKIGNVQDFYRQHHKLKALCFNIPLMFYSPPPRISASN